MEMEEKDSTETGSAGVNSGSESPPLSGGGGVFPQVMQMAVNMSMERTVGPPPAEAPVAAVVSGGASGGGGGDSGGLMMGKKKRGRPRKYDSEGNLRVPYISPAAAGMTSPPTQGFTLTSPPSSDYSSGKRGRGRHAASSNWQLLASLGELFANTAGGDFTPHVVTVHTGEDVAGKVYSFAQRGARGICILSANGAVSNVTIRQPGSSGGTLTYEGRFEILTLTGSLTTAENGGIKSRTGGLSVSLAGPDGRVIGGGIAGLLTAASPIQMVVGSFTPNIYKTTHKRKQNAEHKMAPPVIHNASASDIVMTARPISQAPPPGSMVPTPPPQLAMRSHGNADNSHSKKDVPNSTSVDLSDCNGSEPTFDQRPYPDINVSIHME